MCTNSTPVLKWNLFHLKYRCLIYLSFRTRITTIPISLLLDLIPLKSTLYIGPGCSAVPDMWSCVLDCSIPLQTFDRAFIPAEEMILCSSILWSRAGLIFFCGLVNPKSTEHWKCSTLLKLLLHGDHTEIIVAK